MSIIESIKKHPLIVSIFFGAAIIGVVSTYTKLWEAATQAWQAHFHPSSYSGELCDTQHTACEDPADFIKVLKNGNFSTISLEVTLISPPRMGACVPSLREYYDAEQWHPVSLDTDPSDGCEPEILIPQSSLRPLPGNAGATYYRLEGDFLIVHVDGTSGPFGFTGLVPK